MEQLSSALVRAETATSAEDCREALRELRRRVVVYGVDVGPLPAVPPPLAPTKEKQARPKLSGLVRPQVATRQPRSRAEPQVEAKSITKHVHEHLSVRARAWKVLLGVRAMDKKKYLELIGKGEHAKYGPKIKNDTFRTFKNCKEFEDVVPEARIVRVLNAFVHSYEQDEFTYVQGMNVIAGVLLYVMPELDAFHCFNALIAKHISAYMSKNLDGVAEGCTLLEECLRALDPQLASFLIDKMHAQTRVYAFAPIMTLSACCPPLDSIVQLWDIYFAAGVHLNVMFYASQLMLLRYELMDENNDLARQYISGRDFPKMDAGRLIAVAIPFLLKLDKTLVARLEKHTRNEMST